MIWFWSPLVMIAILFPWQCFSAFLFFYCHLANVTKWLVWRISCFAIILSLSLSLGSRKQLRKLLLSSLSREKPNPFFCKLAAALFSLSLSQELRCFQGQRTLRSGKKAVAKKKCGHQQSLWRRCCTLPSSFNLGDAFLDCSTKREESQSRVNDMWLLTLKLMALRQPFHFLKHFLREMNSLLWTFFIMFPPLFFETLNYYFKNVSAAFSYCWK